MRHYYIIKSDHIYKDVSYSAIAGSKEETEMLERHECRLVTKAEAVANLRSQRTAYKADPLHAPQPPREIVRYVCYATIEKNMRREFQESVNRERAAEWLTDRRVEIAMVGKKHCK